MQTYKKKILLKKIKDGGFHIFLKCKLNGIDSLVIIDTGASSTVFDSSLELINSSQFKKVKIEFHSLNSSDNNTFIGSINSFKIGKFSTKLDIVAFSSLDYINDLYQSIDLPKVAGIIGSDFLKKYKAIINYDERSLELKKI
ncbi:MAG: retropepsin-like domain-containing protein [Bacteroidales bacterium]|jgi:enoyl-[acyl-carrier-protein] reductase (NADH)|nr:retropepsin-like domain-containing protein [Bacteroidales bacterium]